MGFKEELLKLSTQVKERIDHITNEEMTKQALIIPFIQLLGFDVFNPLEVRPEYYADFGKKKGEKVDYALFKNNEPIIFLEAKSVQENLNNHDAQLSRYFNSTTNVKLGVLTNGVVYKFFTDLNANNVMDEIPFLKIDVTDLRDSDIENLLKLRKDSFDSESLINYAEELVYTSTLKDTLRNLFSNPSDEFIRFIIKDLSETRVTSNVIDRFRPLVKKSISNAVLEIVSKGLYGDEDDDKEKSFEEVATSKEINEEVVKKGVITTKDELRAYELIKSILCNNNIDTSELGYKDTTNYFSIYNKSVNKWVIRINLDSSKKNVMSKLPIEVSKQYCGEFENEIAPKSIGENRVYINSIEDLNKLNEYIVESFKYTNQ